MPKVSVIIPIYNVASYLPRCLDGLLNQTLTDIEIILIDDCSTDNSLEIALNRAKTDNRIKVIASEKNQGAAVARNKGLDIAQGEYLGFIDPDDTIDLNYYEELYKKAKETNADIVKCQLIMIDVDNKRYVSGLNDIIRKGSKYNFSYEWTCGLYKTSLIFDNHIRFIPEIIKAQDSVFLTEIILKAKSLALIDGVYYYYYRREDSLDAKQISIDKVKSALMASEYILAAYNKALDKELPKEYYIDLYVSRLNSILSRTILQNNSKEAHDICVKKYIKLFHENLMPDEIDEHYKQLGWNVLLSYVKNHDFAGLSDFMKKYGSLDKYFMQTALVKLRSKVKTNLKKQ